ncbi:Vacuolar iron transporter 1 [Pleurostoma richardsiae]|uniref:Vacuolar iron transporter 1 n=1 Tax=Pleurostoma richardsiae TaxID=41990 RepID=A0AA38RQ40_9PEZI|nr:Vacuolar iron transporter 1 [Pleurostoma richardsiae]
MSVNGILSSIGLGRVSASKPGSSMALPLYSPLAPSEVSMDNDASSSASASRADLSEIENDQLHPAQRRGIQSSAAGPTFQLPTLTRFLADFTLGFADGLTVPFALTAGLSSLGHTDTVIYAGMAEICAGSISMGIGGYLSARGENAAAARQAGKNNAPVDEVEHRDDESSDSLELRSTTEKTAMMAAAEMGGPTFNVVDRYLAPLELPEQVMALVAQHVRRRPDIAGVLAAKVQGAGDDEEDETDERLPSPIMVGLSVSLGYLLGGLLPLFPYFFVSQVGDGLAWSFGVCVLALFVFGFSKDFALNRDVHMEEETARWSKSGRSRRIPWKAVRSSLWEGFQMVILGSVAAVAAVLCVRAFEGMKA